MSMQTDLITPRMKDCYARGLWRDETLNDYLDRHARGQPDAEAVVEYNSTLGEVRRLTYRELESRVASIAGGLQRLGVTSGDVVSWQLPNWWEFTALYLACARIGAIANPLMPIFRARELRFMLGLAESKVIVVPRNFNRFDYPEMVERLRATELPALRHVLVVNGEGENDFANLYGPGSQPAPYPEPRPRADELTQLLYTSGTTGEPKGATHTPNTLLSILRPFIERMGLGSDEVIHMATPMAHQLGFMYGLLLPVMLGAKAVLQDAWKAPTAVEIITKEKATYSTGATPFLADLVETIRTGGHSVPSLRVFVSAGAPIPPALVRNGRETLGTAIISGWGMTENGLVTCTMLDDPDARAAETDGCCLPGMTAKIVDDAGAERPPGTEGRLLVRGCSLFAGYLKRPHLNNVDADGWFDTGDLARMDEHGYIRICGRSKDVIIRGGENIPVVEIEGLLFKHPAITSVAIVGFPDARLGERAVAFVSLREGASLSFEEMVNYLEEQEVARQYLPERLEIMSELPRTPSGKIQKFKLREMAEAFGETA